MNRPEPVRFAHRYREGEPVFSEHWHAQVIALVELLVADGRICPEDWAKTLGAELDLRASDAATDTDAIYYQAVLKALETILDGNRAVSRTDVDKRETDWRKAYLSTPHGMPVVLSE